jgi:hypothetical protein
MTEETAKPKSLRERLTRVTLLPDTAVAAASGGDVAMVDLKGRSVCVRAATMRDLARVEAIIGKAFFASKFNIATDATQDQFIEIVAMALSRNAPPITKDDLLDLGVSEWGKLVEVGLCFLSAAAL